MRVLTALIVLVSGVVLAFGGEGSRGTEPDGGGAGSPTSFAFLYVQADRTTPVTYSSCGPIRFEVNPRTMPSGAEGVVEEAIARIAEVSGLELVVSGTTARVPGLVTMSRAPILVAWTDPDEFPRLDGEVAGAARSVSAPAGSAEVFVTGQVALDGPDAAMMLAGGPRGRDLVRALVMHELGHVLGLDHVDDPSQLMHHDNVGVLDLQAGDRAGLARLGQGPCADDP